jgi:hypothetical protein
MVPSDLPERGITPFLATVFNLREPRAYLRDEQLRRAWIEHHWPIIQRLIIHFENGNDDLFTRDSTEIGQKIDEPSRRARLGLLGHLKERAFDWFTINRPSEFARVRQRIALASSGWSRMVRSVAEEYVKSGRMRALWREINHIRREFVSLYHTLSPVVQMTYWSKDKNRGQFTVSDKRFEDLRQLYVNCFETLCRLMVIAVGYEALIHHGVVEVPNGRRRLTLWEFEELPNGKKIEILKSCPIADLFVPWMDNKLRNGIGHHAAHFILSRDEIVYYTRQKAKVIEYSIAYTSFCENTHGLFSRVELASVYQHELQLMMDGAM